MCSNKKDIDNNENDEMHLLQNKIKLLELQLLEVTMRAKAFESRIYDLQMQLAQMYESYSWKITKPFRKLAVLVARYLSVHVSASPVADHGNQSSYAKWIESYDSLTNSDRDLIGGHIASFARQPLLSVVMPTYNTPEPYLRRAIDSVREQIYPHWELCIADDASTAPQVRAVLDEYCQADARIKVVYRQENGHISAASNSALDLATGEFVVLLDHDDELSPKALYLVAYEINLHPSLDILYSDQDKIDEQGNRREPCFKPDWNPDLFYSQNMVSHLGVYRTALMRQVGGFRVGYEGSQDYDLCLRCIAKTSAERIRHIPVILYHWRAIAGSTAISADIKPYTHSAAIRALADHFRAINPAIKVQAGTFSTNYHIVYPLPDPAPLVSLIIPTRDGYEVLKQCVESVLKKTTYKNYEILVIDNQSTDKRTVTYLREIAQLERVKVLPYDAPFSYSRINNWAVSQASGVIIGLINDDIEVISPDWLTEMVRHAMRKDIGAVGAKLLYRNNTVQHGGILLGINGIAGHAHHFAHHADPGYFGRLAVTQNMAAVTGACLVVRREVYEQVGGLEEEHLAVALNDVDFCLKVMAAGYRNIWTPYAKLYHHESYSRGAEDTHEKKQRFNCEISYLQKKWSKLLLADPHYNPNLSLFSTDFSLAWPPRISLPWRQLVES